MGSRKARLAGNFKVATGLNGGVFGRPGDVVSLHHQGVVVLGVESIGVTERACWIDVVDGDGGC